jgi:hypothetical protein
MAVSFKVQGGNTLWGLANQYTGNGGNWNQIAALNPGINPNNLKVGSSINLPSTWNTGLSGSTYGGKSASTTAPASSKGATTVPNSTNYATNYGTVSAENTPYYTTANNILKGTIPTVNNLYDTAESGQKALEGTINTMTTQGTTALQQAGANAEANQSQAGMYNANILRNESQAASDNIRASAAARGMGTGSPFAQAESVAAGQPYAQQLQALNASTAASIGKSALTTQGDIQSLNRASMADLTSIGNNLANLYPEQASAISKINTQISKNDIALGTANATEAITLTHNNQSYAYDKQQLINEIVKQTMIDQTNIQTQHMSDATSRANTLNTNQTSQQNTANTNATSSSNALIGAGKTQTVQTFNKHGVPITATWRYTPNGKGQMIKTLVNTSVNNNINWGTIGAGGLLWLSQHGIKKP